MKIQGTCGTCGRTFLLSQIGPDSDAPGRCPFCGAKFARHYGTALIDVVEDAETSASNFAAAMRRLSALETGFDIDIDSFVKGLGQQLKDSDSRAAS